MNPTNPTTFFDTRILPLDIQKYCLMPYLAGGECSNPFSQTGIDNLKAYMYALEPKNRLMLLGYFAIENGFYHQSAGSSAPGLKSNLCQDQMFSVTFPADAHGIVKSHEFHYILTSTYRVSLSFKEYIIRADSTQYFTGNTSSCSFIAQGGAVQDIACSGKGYLFVATEFNLCVYRMSDTKLGQLLYKHDYRFEQIEWDNTNQVLKGRLKNSSIYDTELFFNHSNAMLHTGNPKANLWEKIEYLAKEIIFNVLKTGFDKAWSTTSEFMGDYLFEPRVANIGLVFASAALVHIVLGAVVIHFTAMPVITAIAALTIFLGLIPLGIYGLYCVHLTVILPICSGSKAAYKNSKELFHTNLFA
ncbi:MAG: hypothetical protein KDK62_01180 [Chlamydiia bacterium]|nr:hypothetical protein [Chlamydiia bacterium]